MAHGKEKTKSDELFLATEVRNEFIFSGHKVNLWPGAQCRGNKGRGTSTKKIKSDELFLATEVLNEFIFSGHKVNPCHRACSRTINHTPVTVLCFTTYEKCWCYWTQFRQRLPLRLRLMLHHSMYSPSCTTVEHRGICKLLLSQSSTQCWLNDIAFQKQSCICLTLRVFHRPNE